MPLLHPNRENGTQYAERYLLREMRGEAEQARAAHVLYLTEVTLGKNGKMPHETIAQSICQLCAAYGAELMYQAVGMRLYRHWRQTDTIDVPWWDVLVIVTHEWVHETVNAGCVVSNDLLQKIQHAATTEEAEAVLQSIAPQQDVVSVSN